MVHVVRRAARRISAYWQILTRRARVTSDIDEEMRFHVEMETERLMKAHGLPAAEARRRALISFGGVEKYKEAGHDVHGLRWLDALLLDLRFSLRMLLKHRGLTMVGAFAMAVAIAVGATAFEAISDILDSTLPFPGGDRIVELEFVDRAKRTVVTDAFALVEPDHGLGHRVVVAVSDTADRGHGSRVIEAGAVTDRGVLAASVGVMHDAADRFTVAVSCPQRHLQRVERQLGRHR